MHRTNHRAKLLLGAPSLLIALAGGAGAQSYSNGSAQIPAGSPFNNSSSEAVDFADVDLDGDFDVVIADGGDCCNDQNRLWMNQGGSQAGTIGFFMDESAARLPAVLDDSRDMDFVDFDGDGDQDLYTSNTAQISNQTNRFWTNQGGLQGGGAGFFTDETAARWINVGQNDGVSTFSSVAGTLALGSGGFVDWSCDCVFGDLDNDGDLDLVHSSYGGAFAGAVPSRVFLNDGGGLYEEFNPSGFQLTGSTISDGAPGLWCEGLHQDGTQLFDGSQCDIAETPLGVELGDLDGDFDVDVQHGSRNSPPRLFVNRLEENGGSLSFRDTTFQAFSEVATGGGNYENELGDLDGDGDLDLYGVNWSTFWDVVAVGDGAGGFGDFTLQLGSSMDDNEADFLDYDNDGELDVFVAGFNNPDRLYRNAGAPDFDLLLVAAQELPSYGGTKLSSDPADIDGDGDYDILVSRDNNTGNLLLLNGNQIADTHAPYLPHLEQAADRLPSAVPTVVRVQVYDNASWSTTQFNQVTLEYRVDGGSLNSSPMTHSGGQVFRGEIPGSLVGLVSYQVRSSDAYGNTGSSQVRGYNAGSTCTGALATYCTSKPSSLPGCVPSIGFSGTPSASAGSGFDVSASPAPGGNVGVFFYTTGGSLAVPLTNAFGFVCIDTSTGTFRVGAQSSGGNSGLCDGAYGIDFNAHVATQVDDPSLVPGAQVDLQVWYRDPPNAGGANLTDAGSFVLCP